MKRFSIALILFALVLGVVLVSPAGQNVAVAQGCGGYVIAGCAGEGRAFGRLREFRPVRRLLGGIGARRLGRAGGCGLLGFACGR